MIPANDALQKLLDGNKRFAVLKPNRPGKSIEHRKSLIYEQNPYAVVITCSDSRVCPEIIFDCGLGDIFTIRIAGGALDDYILASIDYAVLALDVNLIVVLGHDNCGVIKCTLNNNKGLSPDIDSLCAHVSRHFKEKDMSTINPSDGAKNVVMKDVEALRAHAAFQTKLKSGNLKIIPAHYNFYTNEVELLES